MNTSQIYVALGDSWGRSYFGGWIPAEELKEHSIHQYIKAELDKREGVCAARHTVVDQCDYLVLDADGLASSFLSGVAFDLEGYREVAEYLEANDDCFSEEAIIGYLNNCGSWTQEHFEDAYCGHWESDCWSSMKNYTYDTFNECKEIPEYLSNYIDWDAVVHDFDIDHWEHEGHIYRSC